MSFNVLPRNALPVEIQAAVHTLISEVAQYRALKRIEIRLRSMTKPRPWIDMGVDRSTLYRRKKRALSIETSRAA